MNYKRNIVCVDGFNNEVKNRTIVELVDKLNARNIDSVIIDMSDKYGERAGNNDYSLYYTSLALRKDTEANICELKKIYDLELSYYREAIRKQNPNSSDSVVVVINTGLLTSTIFYSLLYELTKSYYDTNVLEYIFSDINDQLLPHLTEDKFKRVNTDYKPHNTLYIPSDGITDNMLVHKDINTTEQIDDYLFEFENRLERLTEDTKSKFTHNLIIPDTNQDINNKLDVIISDILLSRRL